MSTLTRRPSGSGPPDYKEYMNFVGAYGKQTDSTDRRDQTAKNLEPTVSAGKFCESYSNFLEKTKGKKFGSVKPPNGAPPGLPPKKTVKTEIFLEINSDRNGICERENTAIEKINLENGLPEQIVCSAGAVEARKKMFENTSNTNNLHPNKQNGEKNLKYKNNNNVPKKIIITTFYDKFLNQHDTDIQETDNVANSKTTPVNSTNSYNSPDKTIQNNEISTDHQDSIKITGNTQTFIQSNNSDHYQNELKKHISTISTHIQKNKMAENKPSILQKPNEHKISTDYQDSVKITENTQTSIQSYNSDHHQNELKKHISTISTHIQKSKMVENKPSVLQKPNEHKISTDYQDSVKILGNTQTSIQSNNSDHHQNENKKHIFTISTHIQNSKMIENKPSVLQKHNEHNVANSTCPPPPPPMPVYLNGTSRVKVSLNNKETKEMLVQRNDDVKNVHGTIPPPPPMPNGYRIQHNPEIHKSKTLRSNKSASLDRNDPLVRKLAYGAMLDMYGAYHDKANSYMATLPKNRVTKNNGLQKIIDNIAAQGGLEKLSGRSNPKAENE